MYRLVNLKTLDVLDAVKNRNMRDRETPKKKDINLKTLDAVKNRNLRDKKTLKKKNIGYVWFLNNILRKEKKLYKN